MKCKYMSQCDSHFKINILRTPIITVLDKNQKKIIKSIYHKIKASQNVVCFAQKINMININPFQYFTRACQLSCGYNGLEDFHHRTTKIIKICLSEYVTCTFLLKSKKQNVNTTPLK